MRILLLPLLACLVLASCKTGDPARSYRVLEGKTMGTTYRVQFDWQGRDLQNAVDSLLQHVNEDISNYMPASVVSGFNRSDHGIALSREAITGKQRGYHFLRNLKAAREAYDASGGAFDPTVMGLVNYWGFGYTGHDPVTKVDSSQVDSLLRFVGFEKIRIEEGPDSVRIRKEPGMQIDFGGTGQGYGVDAIALFLEELGVNDYLVELGGELRSKGKNQQGKDWLVGISVPKEGADPEELFDEVALVNRSMSTSGNYRNYYESGGKKFSHTINPHTGYPERNEVLSVTVFAADCLTADVFATAIMASGRKAGLEMDRRIDGIQTYLICRGEQGKDEVVMDPALEKLFAHAPR